MNPFGCTVPLTDTESDSGNDSDWVDGCPSDAHKNLEKTPIDQTHQNLSKTCVKNLKIIDFLKGNWMKAQVFNS